jgi:hypothetical protein
VHRSDHEAERYHFPSEPATPLAQISINKHFHRRTLSADAMDVCNRPESEGLVCECMDAAAFANITLLTEQRVVVAIESCPSPTQTVDCAATHESGVREVIAAGAWQVRPHRRKRYVLGNAT